jgi:hypothetical protein
MNLLFLFLLTFICTLCLPSSQYLYDLPVVPLTLEKEISMKRDTRFPNGKYIPQLVWIAVRNATDEKPAHAARFVTRNPDWKVSYCDNEEKDRFIEQHFKDSSFFWAYHAINPVIGTAKSELWRLAILYLYGGMYIDDDADVLTPLSQIIRVDDKFLIGKESYNWTDLCYRNEYALSNHSMNLRYGFEKNRIELFDNRFFLNWILFSSPGNPLLLRVMNHVVSLIKYEYLSMTMIKMSPTDHRGKLLMCVSTFPLTLAARELILEGKQKEIGLRVISEQFAEYQGIMKAWNNDHNPNRWVKQMNKKKLPYLSEYLPPNTTLLEGRVVQFHGSKEIFLIENHQKHSFPDFQTFVDHGYDLEIVQLFPNKYLHVIPSGDIVKSSSVKTS